MTRPLPSIDSHAHVGIDAAFYAAGWLPYASSAQDLLEHMDAAGIEHAVCFPMPTPSAFDPTAFARERSLVRRSGRFPFDVENGALIREVDRLGACERLLPFAMFDPGRDVDRQVVSLRTLGSQLKGLKTQTTLLRSPVRALMEEARDLMALAEELDLPVVLHTAVHPDDAWAQVQDCLAVAAAYPRVRFSVAHSLRFDAVALGEARELDNVWVDCSAHLLHCELARADAPQVAPPERRVDVDYASPAAVLEAVYELLPGRYLWGSDCPFQSWSDDEFSSIYRYADEAAILAALPTDVAASMTRVGPHGWLTGSQ